MKSSIVLFILFPILAFAQTTTYSCNYTNYSDEEGNHKVMKKFELNFHVDKTMDKSYIMAFDGTLIDVHRIENQNQISFLEITPSGNLMTTAIDSNLNSVHSRNTVTLGEMLPSQYYGTCVVK